MAVLAIKDDLPFFLPIAAPSQPFLPKIVVLLSTIRPSFGLQCLEDASVLVGGCGGFFFFSPKSLAMITTIKSA